MAKHAWFLPEPTGVPKGLSEGQRQPLHIIEAVGRLAAGSPTS